MRSVMSHHLELSLLALMIQLDRFLSNVNVNLEPNKKHRSKSAKTITKTETDMTVESNLFFEIFSKLNLI